jgi:hypothetical protein
MPLEPGAGSVQSAGVAKGEAMNQQTGTVIVILLVCILGTLWFGRDAMVPAIGWGVAAFVALAIVYAVIRGIWVIFAPEYEEEAAETKSKGGSPILIFIVYLGAFLNVGVLVWSIIQAFNGMPFQEAFVSVPFVWVPLLMIRGGYFLNVGLENLSAWRRKRQR